MSKLSFVVLTVFVIGLVAAQEVLREFNNNDGSGVYSFGYETSNQHFSEAGALKDDGSQYVQGAYSFVGDDGETYWVNYTADEEGFHPIVGSGPGGIGAGQDAEIDPNALKSLVG